MVLDAKLAHELIGILFAGICWFFFLNSLIKGGKR